MTFSPEDLKKFKKEAAYKAVECVQSGMVLGLGTGSTAEYFIQALGNKVREGLKISGIPTSEQTARLAQDQGIPLKTFSDIQALDMTVDGADELTHTLALIKGGGGALLYEKIVACASRRVVIIADYTKVVPLLGRFPLPVEVAPFGWESTKQAIEEYLRNIVNPHALEHKNPVRLRHRPSGAIWVTDGGHYILDVAFSLMADPHAIANYLDSLPGVLGHGLFLSIAHEAWIGGPDGVQHLYGET